MSGRLLDSGGVEAEDLNPARVRTPRQDGGERVDRAPRQRRVGVRLDGVTSMRNSAVLAGFTEVLIAWSWWDAPRDGVVRIDGRPHRFRCDFDEALDDYPDDYRVWPHRRG